MCYIGRRVPALHPALEGRSVTRLARNCDFLLDTAPNLNILPLTDRAQKYTNLYYIL
jgi:hypothetical protein